MGLFSINKEAGENVIDTSAEPGDQTKQILNHLENYNLIPEGLSVAMEGTKLKLSGKVASQIDKNRILATAANIRGISEIEERIGINTIAPDIADYHEDETVNDNEGNKGVAFEALSSFYTVKKGDYLSKIARQIYGDANKYSLIFEANQPMLKDPALIYQNQVLVVPKLKDMMK